mgnify:CR=1 FL=1
MKIKRPQKSQAQVRSVKAKAFSIEDLRKDILHEAKLLKISETVAETIADRAIGKVGKWAEKRAAVTSDDLNRQIAKELEKYNADLAYVYQNRGKII